MKLLLFTKLLIFNIFIRLSDHCDAPVAIGGLMLNFEIIQLLSSNNLVAVSFEIYHLGRNVNLRCGLTYIVVAIPRCPRCNKMRK